MIDLTAAAASLSEGVTEARKIADPFVATEKQVAFALALGRDLRSLVGQDEDRKDVVDSLGDVFLAARSDRRKMSTLIDSMLTLVRDWRSTDRAAQPAPEAEAKVAQTPEGVHRLDGEVFKVQRAVNGSGRLYAKRLAVTDHGEDSEPRYSTEFVYAPGVARRLSEDTLMAVEEAAEYGRLYGTCIVCGRTLTDEGSIARGIGPVCAEKF